jgi:hypothetical protein
MSTVLVVNMITQSSTRVGKVNEHLAVMEALESVIATLRGEIANRKLRQSYAGAQNGDYRWEASVVGKANSPTNGAKRYLNLYRVRIRVYHDSERPRLELTTIIPDR